MEIDNNILITFAQMNIEGYPCVSSMTSFLRRPLKVSSTVDVKICAKPLFFRIQWFKFYVRKSTSKKSVKKTESLIQSWIL